MMKWFRRKKGQNVAEYAILIALVIGAVIAMQKFVQRTLQSRQKDAVKYMVDTTPELGNIAQYEPYYQNSSYVSNKDDTERKAGTGNEETFATNGESNRTGFSNTGMSGAIGNGITF